MIRGKTVVLRAPEPADVPLLHRWANDPEIWRNLTGWHFPYSLGSTQAWVEKRSVHDLTDQVFCIDVPGRGLVGTANLVGIDWKNRNARHGIMIGEESDRGKGYASDAVFAIMRFAFDELGLHRLDSDIIGSNRRSLRFFEKCGWRVEGVREGWFFRDGARHDQVLIGVTRERYAELARAQAVPSPVPDTASGPSRPPSARRRATMVPAEA